jgi:phosphoribosylglycinamide formyltransferase 1
MRLAVFASGTGSNFQAILDAVDSGTLVAEVVLLVTDRPQAGAVARAERHGVPVAVCSPEEDAESFERELLLALESHGADFVALAGFMRHVPSGVVNAFRHRILNIHPALLPAFGGAGYYGRRVHRAVLEHGARWTGVTVHLVDEDYDTGPIVLQEPVPVQADDDEDTLAARVLEVEHRLYPEALRLFADDRVRIDGRRVIIR